MIIYSNNNDGNLERSNVFFSCLCTVRMFKLFVNPDSISRVSQN